MFGLKYLSQRSSVMWSSFTHSTNLNGPVPTGKSLGSFSLIAFSLTISLACDRLARNEPKGLFRWNFTW